MGWKQFVATMFGHIVSLAWPVVVVAAIYLFREKLEKILPFLRLKYKDLDISFKLDQAEREAAALPTPPADATTEATPEEVDRFEQLAEISPRAAVVEQARTLEEAVLRRAAELPEAEALLKKRSFLESIRFLRKRGIIDAHISAILDDLRHVRNAAIHSAGLEEITKEDALRYRRLAKQVMDVLAFS